MNQKNQNTETDTCMNCRHCWFLYDDNGKLKGGYCNYYNPWNTDRKNMVCNTELDSPACRDYEGFFDL